MNQSFFKPRILLLATALAAGAAGVQATDTTPSATTTPEPASRMSYAPCANLQGVALSDCLKQNAGQSSAAGADANANGAKQTDVPQIGTSSSNDSTQVSASASATNQGPRSAQPHSPSNAAAASSGPRDSTQWSTSASARRPAGSDTTAATSKANGTESRFRADLRNCAQMTGVERDSCIDRAIDLHAQG